jgi:hypothetical protein
VMIPIMAGTPSFLRRYLRQSCYKT